MTLNPGVLHMHCKLEYLSLIPFATCFAYYRSEPSFTKRVREKQKSKVERTRDFLLRFGYRLHSVSLTFLITEG